MASLDFPSNPTNGQTYALNGVTYYYNSSIGAWLTQLTSMNLSTSSNTQVLFNDAGLANGSSGLVYNKVAGYLGIGTTTPNSSLHLSSSSRTYISVTANAKDWLIDHRGTYDSGSNALSFAYDGTERMRIDSSGNVGIGTSNPVYKLDVNKGSTGYIARFTDGIAQTLVVQTNDASGVTIKNDNNGYLAFSGTSTERMRITSAGYVGIGSNTTPSEVLTVMHSDYSGLGIYRDLDYNSVGSMGTFLNFGGRVGSTRTAASRITGVLENATNGSLSFSALTSGNIVDKLKLKYTGEAYFPYGQIQFPATQNASSDANTLDDYEEGTFTPTIASTGNFTYTRQFGRYTKIGNLVSIQVDVIIGSQNGGSGVIRVGGMPFSIASGSGVPTIMVFGDNNWTTSRSNLCGYQSSSIVWDVYYNSGSNLTSTNITDIGQSGRLLITGTYQTST